MKKYSILICLLVGLLPILIGCQLITNLTDEEINEQTQPPRATIADDEILDTELFIDLLVGNGFQVEIQRVVDESYHVGITTIVRFYSATTSYTFHLGITEFITNEEMLNYNEGVRPTQLVNWGHPRTGSVVT